MSINLDLTLNRSPSLEELKANPQGTIQSDGKRRRVSPSPTQSSENSGPSLNDLPNEIIFRIFKLFIQSYIEKAFKAEFNSRGQYKNRMTTPADREAINPEYFTETFLARFTTGWYRPLWKSDVNSAFESALKGLEKTHSNIAPMVKEQPFQPHYSQPCTYIERRSPVKIAQANAYKLRSEAEIIAARIIPQLLGACVDIVRLSSLNKRFREVVRTFFGSFTPKQFGLGMCANIKWTKIHQVVSLTILSTDYTEVLAGGCRIAFGDGLIGQNERLKEIETLGIYGAVRGAALKAMFNDEFMVDYPTDSEIEKAIREYHHLETFNDPKWATCEGRLFHPIQEIASMEFLEHLRIVPDRSIEFWSDTNNLDNEYSFINDDFYAPLFDSTTLRLKTLTLNVSRCSKKIIDLIIKSDATKTLQKLSFHADSFHAESGYRNHDPNANYPFMINGADIRRLYTELPNLVKLRFSMWSRLHLDSCREKVDYPTLTFSKQLAKEILKGIPILCERAKNHQLWLVRLKE